MIYLNDHLSIVGKIIPDIYLASNVKDFLDSKEDIPRPSRLRMVMPYVLSGDSRAAKFHRNKVGILLQNVDVAPKEFSQVRFEKLNEADSLEKSLRQLAIVLRTLSPMYQNTEVRDLSGSIDCNSPCDGRLWLDETQIRQMEITAGRYVEVSLLYDVVTKTQEIIRLTRTCPPIKDPAENKDKVSLGDLIAAGGFA